MNLQVLEMPDTEGRNRKEKTRDALIAAGIFLFSKHGYEATSTRQIETHAGVQRSLMTYHFGSKEHFWKACMTELNNRMDAHMSPVLEAAPGDAPGERLREMIRSFVRASAAVPEISRIIFDEGRNPTWRLEWLVEHYAHGFFGAVGALFEEGRRAGLIADIPKVSFYYMVVGAALIFAMSAECTLLTGEDAFKDANIEAQAEAVARVLVPNL